MINQGYRKRIAVVVAWLDSNANAAKRLLSYREREVLRLRYGGRHTIPDVARIMGITYGRARYLEQGAIAKIGRTTR